MVHSLIPDPGGVGGLGADPGVEVGLAGGQEVPAGDPGLDDGPDGVPVEVVVVEVLVGDDAEGADPVEAEHLRLLQRAERGVVGQYAGEEVLPVHQEPAHPAQVVQPEVVHRQPVRGDADGGGDPASEAGRGVADTEHPVAQHLLHRLGDDPGRVGEVDDVGLRGEPGDGVGDLHHDRHGAEGVGDAAGAGRLLPQHVQVQGDVLVTSSAFGPTDADGGEHEPAVGDGGVEVGGDAQGGDGVEPGSEPAQDVLHHREPVGLDVVQHHLGDPGRTLVPEQRLPDEGGAETAAAQDAQLHACAIPDDTGTETRARLAPSSGDVLPAGCREEAVPVGVGQAVAHGDSVRTGPDPRRVGRPDDRADVGRVLGQPA